MNKKEYLKHWGIPGMKWGERNGPPYPLSSSQMSSEERKHRINDKLTLKDKSDDELKKEVSRMKLEKEYRDLSKSSVINGSKFTNALLLYAGTLGITTLASAIAGGLGAGAGKSFVSSIFSNPVKKQ